MRTFFNAGAIAIALTLGSFTAHAAPLTVSGSVGGVPDGVILDNLDWLTLGAGGGVSPQSGVTINFTPDAQAVQGSLKSRYAAPFLSNNNGAAFGNPDGVDTTTYITTGSTGAFSNAEVEILLPGDNLYFGLLWGSVDRYNSLSFYSDHTLIDTIIGSDVTASPNGDQGVNGTLYVNITSTLSFNRIVATSSQYAFEFDNIAFNRTSPVPEPSALALLGLGLLGAGAMRRRRN